MEKIMRIQDYFIETTRRAAEEFFRYAKAVPADKLEWKPLDAGRSVLDLCRELAMTPTWAVETINPSGEEHGEEAMAAMQAEMNSWTTVEACEAQFEKRAAALYDLYLNLPDERLNDKKWLPYAGGRDFSMVEMMEYPSWNLNYHTGQVAYIQILLGDKEMH